jgi:DNA polymerase/3'-5' exonuclease PolX
LDTVEEGIESYIRCESLPDKPALKKLNNGTRYMKLYEDIVGIQIDLFIVRPPAQWGPIISIRTGSAEYSKRLVTALRVKGLRCEDGQVLDRMGKVVSCPEEIDFFRAAGLKMINPIYR